jgi:hypothetical protein
MHCPVILECGLRSTIGSLLLPSGWVRFRRGSGSVVEIMEGGRGGEDQKRRKRRLYLLSGHSGGWHARRLQVSHQVTHGHAQYKRKQRVSVRSTSVWCCACTVLARALLE